MYRRRSGLLALAAAVAAGAGLAVPAGAAGGVFAAAVSRPMVSGPVLPCGGPAVTVSLTDPANFHGLFAAYGNKHPAGSYGDWTGGDTDYSATLPDGRRVWDFTDAQLGTVRLDKSTGHYRIVDNGTSHSVAVVEAPRNGAMTATIHSGLTFPGSTYHWYLGWIPEPSSADHTAEHTPFYNSLAMITETDAVSHTAVLRVVGIYGGYSTGDKNFVATFGVGSDLPRLSVVTFAAPKASADNRGILWGDALIREGSYTYVYGSDNPRNVPYAVISSAYLARAPKGELDRPSRWTYFNGNFRSPGWVKNPAQAQPIIARNLSGYPCERGVAPFGAGYSAAKLGGSYYVFTRDPNAFGSLTAYSSPTPWGPWSGPSEYDPANGQFGFYTPPSPPCPPNNGGCVYGPHIHADVPADASGYLLSYDVNSTLQDRASNIEDYRPKFLRIRVP
jgi:hypothetical protein